MAKGWAYSAIRKAAMLVAWVLAAFMLVFAVPSVPASAWADELSDDGGANAALLPQVHDASDDGLSTQDAVSAYGKAGGDETDGGDSDVDSADERDASGSEGLPLALGAPTRLDEQDAEAVLLADPSASPTASPTIPATIPAGSTSSANPANLAETGLIAGMGAMEAAPSASLSPITEAELETASTAFATEDVGLTMHRLYNPNSGEHFYTADEEERDGVVKAGWKYEGVGWIAPSAGDEVYRLYNPNAGDHHYTPSTAERDYLVNVGWKYEGVGWFSGGMHGLYRQYNPNAVAGAHNFTSSQDENDYLVNAGWRAEGIGWYALADTQATLEAGTQDIFASACARVPSAESELHVISAASGNTNYLFLPSYADLTAVRLSAVHKGAEVPIMVADSGSSSFTTVAVGDTVNVAALSTVTADNGARLLRFKTEGTSVVQELAIMVSAAISTVNVSSMDAAENRAFVEASADHSAKADVRITVVDAVGATVYDKDGDGAASTIKGRGNTTWENGEKKPYQISLSKKADLLGTGDAENRQKKWVLLANADDATLLHNTVAYNMALELGMVGTECAPVDLYYDGQYRGNYLLCEKIQVKEGRVDIADLEEAIEQANDGVDLESLPTAQAVNDYGFTYQYVSGVTDPDDITGGYLLEIDDAYYESEACWFKCSFGTVVVKSPEFCSKAAMGYISQYVERAITRLADGKTSENPGNSHGALFDLDSLARTYLISEYAKNVDAFFSSTYLYKDSGATPVYAQPIWDFDGSMGVRTDWDDSTFVSYQGFVLPSAYAVSANRPIPAGLLETMQDRARELWDAEFSPLVRDVLLSSDTLAVGSRGYLHSLEHYRAQIAASQKMDEVLFGLTAFSNVMEPFETYELNCNYLRDWLGWRAAWMDDNIERISGGAVDNAPWTYDGVDYGLVFDAGYYIKNNLGVIGANTGDVSSLAHFVREGMALGLVASRNFNVQAYRARYADLRELYGDDLVQYYLHYIETGFKEGLIAT